MTHLGFSETEWEEADHWQDGKADRLAAKERTVSTTIEERINDIRSRQARMAIRPRQPDYEAQDIACAAIIAGWNAAHNVLEDWIGRLYEINEDSGEWYCYYCNANTGWRPLAHAPETCIIAAAQAALAQMAGLHETADVV